MADDYEVRGWDDEVETRGWDDEEPSTLRRFVADPAISVLKGAIGVPEAAVGLADIATGGRAGKLAEKVGFRPQEAKAALDMLLTQEQQDANRRVQETKGFLPTIGTSLENPSTIAHSAIESLPSMGAGGVVGRGILAAAPKVAPLIAGAIGEGAISAGQAAEQVRQATDDGLLTPGQSALAAGSGTLTGLLGAAGGKIAQRFGFADIDTMLASGTTAAAKQGLARRIIGGAISEGLLEEMPQSSQEQIAQNVALGRPWSEGVQEAGAVGALVGGVMGGGGNLIARQAPQGIEPPLDTPPKPIEQVATEVMQSPDLDSAINAAEAAINAPVQAAFTEPEQVSGVEQLTPEVSTSEQAPEVGTIAPNVGIPELSAPTTAYSEPVGSPITGEPVIVGGVDYGRMADMTEKQLEAISRLARGGNREAAAAELERRAATVNQEEPRADQVPQEAGLAAPAVAPDQEPAPGDVAPVPAVVEAPIPAAVAAPAPVSETAPVGGESSAASVQPNRTGPNALRGNYLGQIVDAGNNAEATNERAVEVPARTTDTTAGPADTNGVPQGPQAPVPETGEAGAAQAQGPVAFKDFTAPKAIKNADGKVIVRKDEVRTFKTEKQAKAYSKSNALKGYVPRETSDGWVLSKLVAEEEPTSASEPRREEVGETKLERQSGASPTGKESFTVGTMADKSAAAESPVPSAAGLSPGAGTVIYRAHTRDSESVVRAWTSWSEDEETAAAYTDNPGFGGPNVRSARVDLSDALDLGDIHGMRGKRTLAEALGYDDPYEVAQRWQDSGWRYPWEESQDVNERLRASGYKWLRYEDDFPDGAITLVPIQDVPLSEPRAGTSSPAPPAALSLTGQTESEIRADEALAKKSADEKAKRDNAPSPDIRMSRFTSKPGSVSGLPYFQNERVGLSLPRLHETQPIERDGRKRIAFDIVDIPAYRRELATLIDDGMEAGPAKARATSRATVGRVLVNVRGSEFTDFYNIRIKDEHQGRGLGEAVVSSMLDGQDAPMKIHQIEEGAVGFWVKMGAKFPRSADSMEASLDRFKYATYQRQSGRDARSNADRGNASEGASGVRSQTQGGSGEASEAGRGIALRVEPREFRRTLAAESGIAVKEAQAVLDALGVEGEAVESPDDLPKNLLRQIESKGAKGDVRGVFDPATGKIYVIASRVENRDLAAFVALHESAHRGLRALLGPDLDPILRGIYEQNSNVKTKANVLRSKHDLSIEEATEEVIADLAKRGQAQKLVGWDKFVAFIKKWLAERGFKIEWTDTMVEVLAGAAAETGKKGPTVFTGEDAKRLNLGATKEKDAEDGPRLSRGRPKWVENGSAELKSAASKIDTYAPNKSFKEKFAELQKNWADRAIQEVFDPYIALKKLTPNGYILARMVKSADTSLEAALRFGKPRLADDGSIVGDLDMKGFLGHMSELNGEHDRFFMWVAGNRSERLMLEKWRVTYPQGPKGDQAARYFENQTDALRAAHENPGATVEAAGREHLFTMPEIAAMKNLIREQGPNDKWKGAGSRPQAYAKAAEALRAYNRAFMDIAEKTGEINHESRVLWEHDFYIPFFRVDEDMTIQGPSRVKGLVRNEVLKKLKGGTEPLGDLLDNTIRNWQHILSASLANQAAKTALNAAVDAGIAVEADEATAKQLEKAGKPTAGATYVMDDGERHWYTVGDPFVLEAISALETPSINWAGMKLLRQAKRVLTTGVTAAPPFRIRNLIRDSSTAVAQNQMSYNLVKNVWEGYKHTNPESATYAQAMFGGGIIRFGNIDDGKHAEHAKRLILDGVEDRTILDTPTKVRDALSKWWDVYQENGDRFENVNRMSLIEQRKAAGATNLEAMFAGRDSMDFTLMGANKGIRFLAQVVPFLNARAQGLYKTGRAVREDPKRIGYVTGALTLASIALMLAYKDDDEWKKRADWDRDTYFWFKIGDVAFRIPKGFELGGLATLAERGLELLISDEMNGKRFAERLWYFVGNTLSLNPIPQLAKPMVDLYANTDSFTGRQIETRGMENQSKPERISRRTTLVAKTLGKAGNVTQLSPVQIDHLIQAYFGWLGTHAAMTVDVMAEPFLEVPKPARKIGDVFVVGDFVKDLPSSQSRYVEDFYKQAKKVHEVMGDLKQARDTRDAAKVQQILEDKRDEVSLRSLYSGAERTMTDINRKIRVIERSTAPSDEKRARIDELNERKNRLAAVIARRTRERKAATQ